MSAEQRAAIRDWAKETKVDTQISSGPARVVETMEKKEVEGKGKSSPVGPPPAKANWKRRGLWGLAVLVVIGIAVAVLWWRWNRAWEELESGLKNSESASLEKPRAQVPTEVMQKLLVHRVEPAYPAEARKEKLEGIIALDIVVGRDGTVTSMRALNGPDVLARAAMDALRWWKFEPYRVNGEPAIVETTVAVEFKNGASTYRPPAATN
jgi:TonB family protein